MSFSTYVGSKKLSGVLSLCSDRIRNCWFESSILPTYCHNVSSSFSKGIHVYALHHFIRSLHTYRLRLTHPLPHRELSNVSTPALTPVRVVFPGHCAVTITYRVTGGTGISIFI